MSREYRVEVTMTTFYYIDAPCEEEAHDLALEEFDLDYCTNGNEEIDISECEQIS